MGINLVFIDFPDSGEGSAGHGLMKQKVLVVDDSLTVRMHLDEGLTEAGFDVRGVASLAEARDALAPGDIDLVILDVHLPDGDGTDLLREIRATETDAQHLPVMLLSSRSAVEDRVRGLFIGADEYAGKPYVMSYVVARARALVAQRDPSVVPSSHHSVLVIDDSTTFREAIRDALEASGYDAHTSSSGEEGLAKAVAIRPSVIIVDTHLPGIDGLTVVRRVRLDAALRHTPCMMITGSDVVGSEIGAFEAGVDVFLGKRTPPAEVVARVHALLAWSSEVPQSSVSSVLGAKKVIVVGTNTGTIASAIRNESFDLVFARTAEEAGALLAVETPACILVDHATAETCAQIRRALIGPSAILALTTDEDAAIDIFRAGADEVVDRDTPPALLVARVRAQLRRKQLEEEAAWERGARLARELTISEARAAQALAEQRASYLAELERKNAELAAANAELQTFSYTVSHDLRGPLRAIDGFAHALEEDDGHLLREGGRSHLQRIHAATRRMAELIDDLLTLSRVTSHELRRERVDISRLASLVVADLLSRFPDRSLRTVIEIDLETDGDASMIRVLLENLLGNAWKFTQKAADALVEVGALTIDGVRTFFVRDNGVGFDMGHAARLFQPFQRLHSSHEFEGTGIGLATVARIVSRHAGRVWAESAPGTGTTLYFSIGSLPLTA